MPFRDGSGPRGDGRLGRGLGPCGAGGRAAGDGFGGRGLRRRFARLNGAAYDQESLARQVDELRSELRELRGRLGDNPKPLAE